MRASSGFVVVSWLFGGLLATGCGSAEDSDFSPLNRIPVPLGGSIGGWKLQPASSQTPVLTSFVFDAGRIHTSIAGSAHYSARSTSASGILSLVELRRSPLEGFAWTSRNLGTSRLGARLQESTLAFQGIAVHDVQLKELREANGKTWATGKLPGFALDASALANIEVLPFLLDAQAAREAAADSLQWSAGRFHSAEKRYVAHADHLEPAWLFLASAVSEDDASGPARVLVDAQSGEVLEIIPLSLGLSANAWLYHENRVVTTTRQLLPLTDLSGDGLRLESNTFSVVNCHGTDPVRSTSNCNHAAAGVAGSGDSVTYDYQFADERYDEVLGYYAMAWAWDRNVLLRNEPGLSSGFADSWTAEGTRSTLGIPSGKKFVVYTRSIAKTSSGSSTSQNAQCYPWGFTGNSTPVMVVGTGCETSSCAGVLRFLGKDTDVYMHEFHHHIIARSLKVFSGETLALHEALADFFTYVVTDDEHPVIAESIMDGGLRHGTVSGKISDYYDASQGRSGEVHTVGQFVSSVLWELRQRLGYFRFVPGENPIFIADKVVWDAVDLLSQAETFYGFIAGLGKSADAFAAANGFDPIALKREIYSVFAARGFIDAPGADGSLPAPSVYITGDNPSAPPSSAVSNNPAGNGTSQKKKSLCGVIVQNGLSQAQQRALDFASALAFALAAFAPLLFALGRRTAQRAMVRVRVRDSEPRPPAP